MYTHIKIMGVYTKESARILWDSIPILGWLTLRNRPYRHHGTQFSMV